MVILREGKSWAPALWEPQVTSANDPQTSQNALHIFPITSPACQISRAEQFQRRGFCHPALSHMTGSPPPLTVLLSHCRAGSGSPAICSCRHTWLLTLKCHKGCLENPAVQAGSGIPQRSLRWLCPLDPWGWGYCWWGSSLGGSQTQDAYLG